LAILAFSGFTSLKSKWDAEYCLGFRGWGPNLKSLKEIFYPRCAFAESYWYHILLYSDLIFYCYFDHFLLSIVKCLFLFKLWDQIKNKLLSILSSSIMVGKRLIGRKYVISRYIVWPLYSILANLFHFPLFYSNFKYKFLSF
jgi:hypothetical protein